MNKIYKAGKQGGRGVIDIGVDNIGKLFLRTIEENGTITFTEVKPEVK